tara:strand:- start:3832 stop:4170 length:339 start_codon:yes stop_codon:yes gene_type:complete
MKEIFDRVKAHLLKQGERASRQNGHGCYYHTPEGLKCAVGCLITGEAYSGALEGDVVENALVRAALEASGIDDEPDTIDMLCRLQSIHDDWAPNRWEHALDNLEADLFGDAE